MGQHQQVSNQYEMDVLRAQRNAALDTVAHWQGRANESADEVRRLNERVKNLETVNDNYAKEIEAQAKRLNDKPPYVTPKVTMLNTAPNSSGSSVPLKSGLAVPIDTLTLNNYVVGTSEGQPITMADLAAAQHAKFVDSMTTPTSILDHA